VLKFVEDTQGMLAKKKNMNDIILYILSFVSE